MLIICDEYRISMYVMDNDPYQPEQVLAPLICQQCCWRDPDHQNAVRFQVFLDNSYKCVEVILLSPQGQTDCLYSRTFM